MTEKKRKPFNTLTYLSLLTAIVFGIGLLYFYIDRRRLQEETAAALSLDSQAATADSLATAMFQLVDIDNQVFAGQYHKALAGYQSLLDRGTPLPKSMISSRMSFLSDLSDSATDSVKLEVGSFLINSAQDSIAALEQQIEHLRLAHLQTTDSLREEVNNLNRQVHLRNKVLEQKDQFQHKEIKNPEGAVIHYLGQMDKGMAHGTGTGVWQQSGGVYKGNWMTNQRQGYGTYTWGDGEKYEGFFVNDKREGQGTYTWPSGEYYIGMWKDNRRHGQGILYDADGNISFEGEWENDKPKKN